MSENKKKGRPKGKLTLEMERQEKMFAEISKKYPLTKEEREHYETMHKNGEKVRKQILKDYKTHKMIPDDHAYTMASLGDESLEGFEDQIIAQDNYYKQKIKKSTARGGETLSEEADARAKSVWNKNKDLIERINKKDKKLKLHGAATKILNEWAKRGDGQIKPSINSIKNWYHRLISK
jgi:hypothetical protein